MNEKGINQWNNNGYLHNFVTDLTEKGAGREIIKAANKDVVFFKLRPVFFQINLL